MKNAYQKKITLRSILYIILAVVYMVILYKDGQPVTLISDAAFHFSRVEGLVNIWSTPINFEVFGHNGQAANVFYPWLTIYPMYVLYIITDNFITASYIYFGILTFITLSVTDYCTYKMTKNDKVSLLAAVIYSFALYRSVNVFYRIAFGEAISMAILPIVLLGIYNVFYTEKKNWYPLVIGMTLLAYTHMLSLLLASILVFIFMLISFIRKTFNKATFLSLVKATMWSVLMSIGQLVPMLQYQLSVKTVPPTIYNLAENALGREQFFTQLFKNEIFEIGSLGIVIFFALILAVVMWIKMPKFLKDCTILAVVFSIMGTSLIPWTYLNKILGMIQFPWRFFLLATLLASITGAYAVLRILPEKAHKIGLVVLILLIVGLHINSMHNLQKTIDSGIIGTHTAENWDESLKADIYWGVGSQDYIPEKAAFDDNVNNMLNEEHVFINGENKTPKKTTINNSSKSFTIKTKANQTIEFPVYAYAGYHVTCDGKAINATCSDHDLVSVKSKSGTHTYNIYYQRTPLAVIVGFISIFTVIAFVLYILHQKKTHKNFNF